MKDGQLESIAFISRYETSGHTGDQFLYRVRVFGGDRQAIQSPDERYALNGKAVGAARAVMIVRSPQVLDVKVAIPIRELHLTTDDLPAIAEIGLFDLDGERVAVTASRVPVDERDGLEPPLVTSPVPSKSWWFVRGFGSSSPLLLGPFNSEMEAAGAGGFTGESPVELLGGDYVWAVPILESRGGDPQDWAGPCLDETDARILAEQLAEGMRRDDDTRYRIGAPVMLRVSSWMERHSGAREP